MLPVSDSVCAGMIQRVPVETGRKYIQLMKGTNYGGSNCINI